MKTMVLEAGVMGDRGAEIAGTDQHYLVRLVRAEYPLDLPDHRTNGVTNTLDTVATETNQIASNRGRIDTRP